MRCVYCVIIPAVFTAAKAVASAVAVAAAAAPPLSSKLSEFDLHPQTVLQGGLSRGWDYNGVLALQSGVLELFAGMTAGHPPKSRLWSKMPVTAAEGIEIRVDFEMSNNRPDDPRVHGFAIWYTHGEASTSNDLLGGAPDFKGVASFFSTRSRTGGIANSISGSVNDGTQLVTIREVPSQKGVYWNFRGQIINFRLVIGKDEVVAQAKGSTTDKWNDMFALTGTNMYQPDGYIGITAMGDVDSTAEAGESLRIYSLAVYDLSSPRLKAQQPPPVILPPPVAPAVATGPGIENMLRSILQRLDAIDSRDRSNSVALAGIEERLAVLLATPDSGERLLSTSVDVLNSHLNSFKKDLDEHKRMTHHLVTATHDEKQAAQRLHMEGIKVQVERHAKVTWLMLALLMVTAGFAVAIAVKNIYLTPKTHIF